jgi:glycosyltransferase involved in cell wall biosynthesis
VRICLISFEFLPRTGFGGAAALYTDLAIALAAQGHEITVLAGNNGPGVTIETMNGVTRYCFGHRRLRPRPVACIERQLSVLRQFKKLSKARGPFDIIEGPELAAEPLILNAMTRTSPLATRLVTPHYLLHKMNNKRRIRSVDWMERQNAILSDVIIGDTTEWAQDILDDWKIDRSRLRICPLGIDLNRIDRAKDVQIPVNPPYVLFAGRLTLAKGPQVLSAAAPAIIKENPGVKIVFAGGDTKTEDGESVKEIAMSMIPEDLLKSVVFLGFLESWDQLVSLYRNATVCVKADVNTNQSYDTMGQLACGRPLVCSNVGAHVDMIQDGVNGILFDRSNPSELAEAVSRLLSDSNLRERMGRNARTSVESGHTSTISAEKTLRIYGDLAKSR